MKNIAYPLLGAAVVVLLIAGVFIAPGIFNTSSEVNNEEVSQEEGITVSPADLAVGETTEQDGFTIERLPDAEAPDLITPPLEVSTTRPETMDEAVFAQVQTNANQTITVLRDGDNFNAWMNLASYHVILGDYESAEEIYIYLTKRYNPEWQVLANLGVLYSSYLGNLNAAATNFEQAIDLLPENISLYRSLHDVYVQLGNQEQAIAVLREGIAQESRAIDLYVVLARYFKSIDMNAEANAEYDAAIAQAEALGDAERAAQIKAERSQ